MSFSSLRKTVVALSVVAGMAVSSGAVQANTYDLGTLTNGLTLGGAMHTGAGSFSDVFTFTLTSLSNVDFSGFSKAFTMEMYSVGASIDLGAVSFKKFSLTTPAGTIGSSTSGHSFSFGGESLAAGTYSLGISGKTTGFGGIYGVGLNTAAVPEPGEWAMMLAGLGLVGVVARRRNRAV
jgi:hypothetical protein